jgi:hypothetical protein
MAMPTHRGLQSQWQQTRPLWLARVRLAASVLAVSGVLNQEVVRGLSAALLVDPDMISSSRERPWWVATDVSLKRRD